MGQLEEYRLQTMNDPDADRAAHRDDSPERSQWETETLHDSTAEEKDCDVRSRLNQHVHSQRHLRAFCILIHGVVVLAHVALVVIWSLRLEHNIVLPVSHGGTISTIIVACSQVLSVLIAALLVFVTQTLALSAIPSKRQTVTTSHDEYQAWMGVGSALVTAYSQIRLPTSPISIMSIAVYLGLVSILHITTASIFNLQVVNRPNRQIISTTVGLPVYPANASQLNLWPYIVRYLPYLDTTSTIGVNGSILYDILSDNNGTGPVSVGATMFDVNCGVISDTSSAVYSPSLLSWDLQTQVGDIGLAYNADILTSYGGLGRPSGISTSGSTWECDELCNNMIFYVAGPTSVTDSSGQNGSQITLDISGLLTAAAEKLNATSIDELQTTAANNMTILGCTLSMTQHNARVDSQTKRLIDIDANMEKNSSWSEWSVSILPSDNEYAPLLNAWADLFLVMPAGVLYLNLDLSTTLKTGNSTNSYPESSRDLQNMKADMEYIMKQLDFRPSPSSLNPTGTISLQQFESAVANLTALMYWASGHSAISDWYLQLSNMSSMVVNNIEETWPITLNSSTASISATVAILNISTISLLVGMVASVILLLEAIFLTRHSSGLPKAKLSSFGLLEILWLASRQPELQQHVSNVDDPTPLNLRSAGMTEIQIYAQERQSTRSWNANEDHNGLLYGHSR